MTARLVTFEGIEGSGKTTLLRRIESWVQGEIVAGRLSSQSVLFTREPGGTSIGRHIRSWVLDPSTTFHHSYSEFLMFMVDRMEHVAQVIKPALQAGKVVFCDRFIDSTIAYQVGGRGLDREIVDILHGKMGVWPDTTFLLDVPPDEGLRRANARAKLDRFESESMAFHHRVREAYLGMVSDKNRVVLVSTLDHSPEAVFEVVLPVIQTFFN